MGVLISLFIFANLVSQTAMDAMALILCISVLVRAWMRHGSGFFKEVFLPTGFDWLFVIWIGWVVIGFAVNGDTESLWLERLFEFKWILFFYLLGKLFFYLDFDERQMQVPLWCVGVCSFLAIGLFFLDHNPLKPFEPLAHPGRAGGLFFNPMTFALVYSMYFCFLCGIALQTLSWRYSNKWLLWLVVLVSGVALLLSFTRGVWIAMAASLFTMAMIYRKRVGLLVIALGVGLFLALFETWPQFKERVMFVTHIKSYDHERLDIWRANLEMVKDHPILGVGYGENVRRLPEYFSKLGVDDSTLIGHAHNQFLQFAAGTGVIGLLIYIVVVLAFFRLTVLVMRAVPARDFFHRGLALGCFGAQLCFQISSLTESNFEHSKVKYTLALVWAVVIWLSYRYRVLREPL